MIFAFKLKRLREDAKISANAVANLTGIDPSTYYKIEAGKRKPSKTEVARLAALEELNVTAEELTAWRYADIIGMENLEAIFRHVLGGKLK